MLEKGTERTFIYILTNKRHGTLYTGLTTNLMRRMQEHKTGLTKGFVEKYNLKHLVYYEIHEDIKQAAHRERLLKKWKRQWKIDLIEKEDPDWYDLYEDLKRNWN